MAKRKGTTDEETLDESQTGAAVDDGEDKELTDEQLTRRQEAKQQQDAMKEAGRDPTALHLESSQNLRTDQEASGGRANTGPNADLVVVGNRGGKPIRENRREARLKAEAERGPLARYQFRLMVGGHSGQDYEAPILLETTGDRAGQPRADRRRPSRSYEAADIVWDNVDLAKICNRPGSIKFRLVKDWGEGAYTDGIDPMKNRPPLRRGGQPIKEEAEAVDVPKKDELMEMSVGDLREMAAREEMNLHGASTKEEVADAIIKEMRSRHRASRTQA